MGTPPEHGSADATLSPDEAQTHFDLALAYEEMGLLADALDELRIAARAPALACASETRIAAVRLATGDAGEAIAALHRALGAPEKTRGQHVAVLYALGDAYELDGSARRALHYFQHVALLDAEHDDPRGSVAERIRRLAGRGGPS